MRRLFSVEIVFVIGTFLTRVGGGTEKLVSSSGVNVSLMLEGGKRSRAYINFRLYVNLGILFSPGSDLTWNTGSFSVSPPAFR